MWVGSIHCLYHPSLGVQDLQPQAGGCLQTCSKWRMMTWRGWFQERELHAGGSEITVITEIRDAVNLLVLLLRSLQWSH